MKGLPPRWIIAIGIVLACCAYVRAQAASVEGVIAAAAQPGQPSTDDRAAPSGFLEIVFAGGVIGTSIMVLLIGLSIAMVALVVEHLLTLRRDVLIPPDLEELAAKQLAAGNVTAVDQGCQQRPSFLSFVLRAGLSELEGGWSAVEKALEDATAEQAARLMRRIEYFSVIGSIAPMIGLLGTVVGMLLAFREVAETQGAARAAELASGIYQALVTTVAGLLVAIPSLAALAVFRNRLDQLVAETAYAAQHVLRPLKRRQVRRPAPPPAPRTPT